MKLPYTGSALKRRWLQSTLLLFFVLPMVSGQLSKHCSHEIHGIYEYENPLNARWLSAYDVKSYDLALTVSNLNTVIDGSAFILVEAIRKIDTLVFELQDDLNVSSVISDSHCLEFEHSEDVLYIKL